ncbi:MAG: hypothetical protein ABIR78_13150 [Ferruginibacter sp.]
MQNSFKILFSLIIIIISISCNPNSTQAEKDYIKNLEEKNRALENELQTEKNKPPVIINKIIEPQYQSPDSKNFVTDSKDYFTIGSSENEVIEVMGDPTEIRDFEYTNEKWLHYGRSYIVLRNNKVKEYHNWENNLKIKIKTK